MSTKTSKVPDSDRFARKQSEDLESEETADPGKLASRQVSNKSGKHSSVEKQAASRPEFAPRAKPVAGAVSRRAGTEPGRGIPRSKTKGKRA
ncbi:MAG TPA: hypothetical protein VFW83_03255 [Bryobacteraceae bacterium]|nr:hypothetical protein [Bryobacteraceae bacterium]